MISRYRVYPYKQGSRSARLLAKMLGGKVLRHVNSNYIPRNGDVVVNWGSSSYPDLPPSKPLNSDISLAKCKLRAFKKLSSAGVSIPAFWEARQAVEELPEGFYPIVCRTVLDGHSGEGIVIANSKEELVTAPLYTQYIKKKEEYRVHVFQDEVFFVQRKARKFSATTPDWRVRNLSGGFVFVECPLVDVVPDVVSQAIAAISALNLDFGGVDVIWNEDRAKAYVLEVNTACGLEERTAEKYAEIFKR